MQLYGMDKSGGGKQQGSAITRVTVLCCSFNEELFVILFKNIEKLTVCYF